MTEQTSKIVIDVSKKYYTFTVGASAAAGKCSAFAQDAVAGARARGARPHTSPQSPAYTLQYTLYSCVIRNYRGLIVARGRHRRDAGGRDLAVDSTVNSNTQVRSRILYIPPQALTTAAKRSMFIQPPCAEPGQLRESSSP